MNKELIEKLKKDSQKVYDYTDGGYTPLYTLDIEKFAKLIVSECAGIYEAIDNGNKVQGTDNYLKALKLRFGEIK